MRGGARNNMNTKRGQTTLDFVIGISVFLGVIFFIFLFAPGILTPFTATGQSEAVTVDRTADYLAQDALGSPERPYLLDRGCTVAFFNRSADDSPYTDNRDCRYNESANLTTQLGFSQFRTVNVTILGNVSGGQESVQLYWDNNTRTLTDQEDGNTTLAIGDNVEQRRESTTATRVVQLHGQDVIMRVVVTS